MFISRHAPQNVENIGFERRNFSAKQKVENIGFEPMTSCMPCKRSNQLS